MTTENIHMWNSNYEPWDYLSEHEHDKVQDKLEKYPHKKDKILAKANKKGKKIYERFLKCHEILDNLPEPNTPEQEWFINQMDRCLESATNGFMKENCDDFDIGLKLLKHHLLLYDKHELIAKTEFQKKLYIANVDHKGQTLLFHAIRWFNMPLVQHLLKLGFNLEHRDNEGNTPIFSATGRLHKKNKECVNLLIAHGANLSVVNKNGKMPWQVGLHRSNNHILIHSIQKGIRVTLTLGHYKRLPHFVKRYKNIVKKNEINSNYIK